MDTHVLDHYRVLDLTGPLGFLAGKILADLGADVVKVEPPDGDAGRHKAPFWQNHIHPETSLYWMAYNTNKRSVTLNLNTVSGQDLFRKLLKTADFVLESFPPGYLAARRLDYPRLQSVNSRLIWVSLSPYGQTGPMAGDPADDLEILASSGFLSLLGDRRRPPVRTSEPQSYLWAGMTGSMAALVALEARERTGHGQHIDVSAQASMMWALSQAPLFWDVNRETVGREGNYLTGRNINGAVVCAIYACADGYINFALYGGVAGKQSNRGLVQWMRERGSTAEVLRVVNAIDWDIWDVVSAPVAEVESLEGALHAFFLTVSKDEFTEAALRYRILGYPVADAYEILNNPHLDAVDFWRSVSIPGLGEVKLPGDFARFSDAEPVCIKPPPHVGEHNVEIYQEVGLTASELTSLREAGIV